MKRKTQQRKNRHIVARVADSRTRLDACHRRSRRVSSAINASDAASVPAESAPTVGHRRPLRRLRRMSRLARHLRQRTVACERRNSGGDPEPWPEPMSRSAWSRSVVLGAARARSSSSVFSTRRSCGGHARRLSASGRPLTCSLCRSPRQSRLRRASQPRSPPCADIDPGHGLTLRLSSRDPLTIAADASRALVRLSVATTLGVCELEPSSDLEATDSASRSSVWLSARAAG